MERLGGEVRHALRGVGVPDAGALAEITPRLARRRRRRNLSRGLATADVPGRHPPRRDGLLCLVVRADLARGGDRGQAPRGAPRRSADGPPLRGRTDTGTRRRAGVAALAGTTTAWPGGAPSRRRADRVAERRGAAADSGAGGCRKPCEGRNRRAGRPAFLIDCCVLTKARFAGLFLLRREISAA